MEDAHLREQALLLDQLCFRQKSLPGMSVDNDTALERWQTADWTEWVQSTSPNMGKKTIQYLLEENSVPVLGTQCCCHRVLQH